MEHGGTSAGEDKTEGKEECKKGTRSVERNIRRDIWRTRNDRRFCYKRRRLALRHPQGRIPHLIWGCGILL